MLYPQVEFQTWSERYRIEVKTHACLKCKKEFSTTIPIAIRGYRGLQAPVHECGIRYAFKTLVPVDRKEKEFWIGIRYGM